MPPFQGFTPPGYLQQALEEMQPQATRTSSTTPGITPENYNEYYQAAFGGVPMGVDQSALQALYESNVIQPGMEAGRRAAARRTGASGFAPNAGAEQTALTRLRGEYGGGLANLLTQAMSQNVQNTLAARGQIAGGMLGGRTTTETVSAPNPRGRFGGFQQRAGGMSGLFDGGGGGTGQSGGPTGGWKGPQDYWGNTMAGDYYSGTGPGALTDLWNKKQPRRGEWSA